MANTTNYSIEKPNVGGARNSWGGIVNVGIDKIDELLHLAMPIGTIQMYPMSTAPTATLNGGTWLVCNGGILIQANYPDLYELIGSTYDASGTNAATHFNLPDFQARVPVGYNVATIDTGTVGVRSIREIGTTADGTEGHVLAGAQIPKHAHGITDPGHIHPIDPTITHSHVGDQSTGAPVPSGGKTGSTSLVITDPEHSHTSEYVEDWASGTGVYRMDYDAAGQVGGTWTSDLAPTNISIDDHDHDLATDASGTGTTTGLTGITTTQTNLAATRLSTTEDQAVGDASHNNMQPYITVQYIILAKHPSF
jgi:microcystin-dependent protein